MVQNLAASVYGREEKSLNQYLWSLMDTTSNALRCSSCQICTFTVPYTRVVPPFFATVRHNGCLAMDVHPMRCTRHLSLLEIMGISFSSHNFSSEYRQQSRVRRKRVYA